MSIQPTRWRIVFAMTCGLLFVSVAALLVAGYVGAVLALVRMGVPEPFAKMIPPMVAAFILVTCGAYTQTSEEP